LYKKLALDDLTTILYKGYINSANSDAFLADLEKLGTYVTERVEMFQRSIYDICLRMALTHFSFYPALRVLPFLLDLSLMGMPDPFYTSPSLDHIDWLDIHPGFRFNRALTAASKLGIPKEDAPNEAYLELIDKICKHEKWLSPTEIAKHANRFRVKSYEEHELYTKMPMFINVNPYAEMRKRHGEAMKAREQDPFIFINTLDKFPQLFQLENTGFSFSRPPMFVHHNSGIFDPKLFGFFFFHQTMRVIAFSSIDKLEGNKFFPGPLGKKMVSPEAEKQHPNLMNATTGLLTAMMWNQVGFSEERFVDLANWPS
jgi:hypothetical protein